MKTRMLRLPTLSLILLTANCALSAPVLYSFSGAELPLIDISGTYSTNIDYTQEEYTIMHSPQGRLTVPFLGHYDDGSVLLDFDGTLHGRVAATESDFRMTINGRMHFAGVAMGRPVSGSARMRVSMHPDATGQQVVGQQSVTVCIPNRGCRSERQTISFPITTSDPTEGDWTLSLEVTNANHRVIGTAVATLSNHRTVSFTVQGSFSEKKGLHRLRLRGADEAKGVGLTLTANAEMELQSLNGRLFGQRLRLP